MSAIRSMRRSQAIQPFGPGSILDAGQECFVVCDTSWGGWRTSKTVRLKRLETLLGAPQGFKLPPVKKDFDGPPSVGPTVQRFPAWLFCPSCRRLYRWGPEDDRLSEDHEPPVCKSSKCRGVLVPMRYVAACLAGHLVDIDWSRWAHSGPSCDNPELSFLKNARMGASLAGLSVRCASCKAGRDLKDIHQEKILLSLGQRCWGRQPFEKRDLDARCEQPLKVLQRSQTAVHFSEILSALDIADANLESEQEPEWAQQAMFSSQLDRAVRAFLKRDQKREKIQRNLEDIQEDLTDGGFEASLDDIFAVIQSRAGVADVPAPDLFAESDPDTTESDDILRDELPALTSVSPPRRGAKLVVSEEDWPTADAAPMDMSQWFSGVYLVEKLRELRVFRGFRRVSSDGERLPPDLRGELGWLPAMEVFGEGFFLEFDMASLQRWQDQNAQSLDERLGPVADRLREETGGGSALTGAESRDPAKFFLLHTFAHILMRQLCYECGYMGAAIRERIYCFPDRAGILIYTADGDSEGSLGGLVRQGRRDRLGSTIYAAVERAFWCANDPICREMPAHGYLQSNRAACHACSLAPETSCAHRNGLLDRELLIGDGQEDGPVGYFDGLVAQGRLEK